MMIPAGTISIRNTCQAVSKLPVESKILAANTVPNALTVANGPSRGRKAPVPTPRIPASCMAWSAEHQTHYKSNQCYSNEKPEQPWLDLDCHEPIDNVSAASTEASDRRYRIDIGPHSGSRTLTLHDPSFIRTDMPVKALTADRDGFSLNATVSCQSYQRDRLERLCGYVTRPATCLERLKVRADGQIQYELKHLFSRVRRRTAPPGRAVTYFVFTLGFLKQTCRAGTQTPPQSCSLSWCARAGLPSA